MASAKGIRAGRAFVELFTDNSALVRGLRQAEAHVRNFGAKLQSIGAGFAKIGALGAIPAALSVKTFASFEAGMSKVKAITGATADEMKALRDQAKELGATTFFTASQVADAQKFLAMAGFTPDQILKASPQVLDLALAGDLDLGMAADIATNISTPFKIAAEDLGRVNDVLAKAATSSNTNVEEMGQAFKYAAPAAAAAGQSIEEMGAAIALMANNGIKADMAGTSVRQMMIKLADSGIRKKLQEQFNIDVEDESGKMKPLLTILNDLKAATSNLSSVEQMGVFFSIFEARAGNSALALANVSDQFEEFRDKMESATGTTKKMAEVMADNLKGDWIAFTSAIEGAQIAFGEAVSGMLRNITQLATGLTRNVVAWITENKKMAVAAATAIIGFLTLGATLISLGITCKIVAVAIGGLATATGILSGVLLSPVRLAFSLVAAFASLGKAMMATKTISLVFAGTMNVVSGVSKMLAGLLAILRVGFIALQASVYAMIGTGYALLAAVTGIRAAFLALYASSQIAYVGLAVFQSSLKMLSGTIIAVTVNFRSWIASLFVVRTAAQTAGTALVVYNGAMKSSTALTAVLNSSTLLLSGSMGAVARLGRAAAGSIVAFSTGTRVAVTASTTLVKSVALIRGSFIALIASQGVVKVALTGFAITVLSLGRAIHAMTLAASVASVRLLFFKAGALAAQAATSLLSARLAFGKSVMLAWSAVCKTAAGSLALLQTASKATAAAITSALLVPLLKVGIIVGVAAVAWSTFGDTLQQVFSAILKHASSFFRWIGGGLQTLWNDFSKYMGMIGDLLVDGKISEAASILWEIIQLEWEKGCLAISDRFGETIDSMRAALSVFAHELNNFWANQKRGDSAWGRFVADWTATITAIRSGEYSNLSELIALSNNIQKEIEADMNRQAEHDLQANVPNRPKTADELGREREAGNKDRAERIAALEKRLDERKSVHEEEKAKEQETPTPEVPDIKIETPELNIPDLESLTGGLDRLKSVSTAGTFNAAAARNFGLSSTFQSQMLSATKQIADNTNPRNQKPQAGENKEAADIAAPEDFGVKGEELILLNKTANEHLRVMADKARNSNGIVFV